MTVDNLLSTIDSYYGPFRNEYVKKITVAYLNALDMNDYKPLWSALLRSYTSSYGQAPDVAIFEKALKIIEENGPDPIERQWRESMKDLPRFDK